MAKKKQSFEEALYSLEKIVENMENSEISLDNSVALYKEGISLCVYLNDSLQTYEKEVTELHKTAEGLFVQKSFEN